MTTITGNSGSVELMYSGNMDDTQSRRGMREAACLPGKARERNEMRPELVPCQVYQATRKVVADTYSDWCQRFPLVLYQRIGCLHWIRYQCKFDKKLTYHVRRYRALDVNSIAIWRWWFCDLNPDSSLKFQAYRTLELCCNISEISARVVYSAVHSLQMGLEPVRHPKIKRIMVFRRRMEILPRLAPSVNNIAPNSRSARLYCIAVTWST